jgi:hypothetical protein
MIHEIVHLGLTKDRLFDLTHHRRSDVRPVGYRFGRISANSFRFGARRFADRARALSDAALRLITAAKLRRLEREFRIHGPQHDWLRIDDDNFTQADR